MSTPTTGHTRVYRPGTTETTADGRMVTGLADRNAAPIISALLPFVEGRSGHGLEIGAGTGTHAGRFADAFPLRWTPSDPDEIHCASINAWAAHHGGFAPARQLDAGADWAPMVADLDPLWLVLSLNVIHIAPWKVAEGLVAGAAQALSSGGHLALYGPFREGGVHTGEGNRKFDEGLRAENPDWGIRDMDEVAALARTAGFGPAEVIVMPANNRLVLFEKP